MWEKLSKIIVSREIKSVKKWSLIVGGKFDLIYV